jgi:two-component system, OmpR family, sensor kinase
MRSALGRLTPVGLRWRLAAWVAAVVLVCTGITFFAVYRGTGVQLRNQIDRELSGDATALARNLTLSEDRTPRGVAETATRYISGQPFSASSTLLFAIVPRVGTSTNRPELFAGAKPDSGETVADQGAENRLSTHLLSAGTGYSRLTLPDVGDLRLLKRVATIPGGLRVTVGVAEPLAPVAHAQRGVAQAFILAGILALAGALLASYLIGTRVSLPLRRMASVAARVDAGDLHPRIHDAGGQGREVRVLADAFNHMLDRLTAAFAGQRAFIADASHELRTPLTVIRGQLEVLAAQVSPSGDEVRRVESLVQSEIGRITRLVDDLLLLVKTEQTQSLRIEPIDLPSYVRELWDGMTPLDPRRFQLATVPEGVLAADPDRLAQALRNLVSNAVEHTAAERGLVRMRIEAGAQGRIRFLVEDDGPGIPPQERERVFDRFNRIDAARDRASGGTGLGLAIVRAIAEAHEGSVVAHESSEGGARMELELPGFTPRERRVAGAETGDAGAGPAGDSAGSDPVAAGLGPRA